MGKKTAGLVLAVTGAVLIISALLLFFHNLQEDQHAGDQSQWVLEEMRQLEDNEAGTSLPASTTAPTEVLPAEMPTVHINGYDYIGTLSVPSLELELPVMAQWDYDRLKIAPCRQFGSSRTDDLVIAAHNYQNHFGRLKELSRVIPSSLRIWKALSTPTPLKKSKPWRLRRSTPSKTAAMTSCCTPAP